MFFFNLVDFGFPVEILEVGTINDDRSISIIKSFVSEI